MKHIFKNFNILGLVAFIAAGIMAISWTEIKQDEEEAKWYLVESDPSNPTEASLQEIKGLYPGTNPGDAPTGDCSAGNIYLCAVQLEVNSSTFPTTMAEADADPGVEIKATEHRDYN